MLYEDCPICNGTGVVMMEDPHTGQEVSRACHKCGNEDEYLLEGGEYFEAEDREMETYWNLFHKNY